VADQGVEHFELEGRAALVMGVDTPAGAAIARAYAEAGARVALCVARGERRLQAAQQLMKEISAEGGETTIHVVERLAGTELIDLCGYVAGELGGLDCVASCGDTFFAKPIGEVTDAELHAVLAENFHAAFFLARAAAGELKRRGNGGTLTFVTHVLGERGLQNTTVYGAAHAAIQALVRALAQELGPHGIRANGIALGWMDWMRDRIAPGNENAERAVRFTIAKRAGSVDDIGPLAVWLAGTGAGYVTGQTFAVDGGLLQHL
jgi:NAD(P)-dependent dehydrogenase (short-subunit alcohol dehydrogenase family)